MGVRCSAGCGHQRSRRWGGGVLGHIHPTPTIARPGTTTLAAMRKSHSASLQLFVEKSWSIVPVAVEGRGKGIPFLAGGSAGVLGTQGHPAEPAGRLIKIYSEHRIALERRQIMSEPLDSCRNIQLILTKTLFVSRKLFGEYKGSPSRPDPDDL